MILQRARHPELDNSRDSCQEPWTDLGSRPGEADPEQQGSTVGSSSLASPRLCSGKKKKASRCSSPGPFVQNHLETASTRTLYLMPAGLLGGPPDPSSRPSCHSPSPLKAPPLPHQSDVTFHPQKSQHFRSFPDVLPGCHRRRAYSHFFFLSPSLLWDFWWERKWLCCSVDHFSHIQSSFWMYYCLNPECGEFPIDAGICLHFLTGLRKLCRTRRLALLWPWLATAWPIPGLQGIS